MKKTVVVLLSFCLFLAFINVSVAAPNSEQLIPASKEIKESKSPLKKHLRVLHVGHGEYSISNTDGQKATLIESENVYRLDDGTFLSYLNEKQLLKVEKLDLHLIDQLAIENVFNSYSINEEIKKDILEMSKIAVESGNNEARASLYTAAKVPQDSGTIGTMAQITSYYTYNGRNLRQDMIYFYDMSTTWKTISSGANTKSVAEGLSNFAIWGVGSFGSASIALAVNLYVGALTAISTFVNLVGYTPIGGATSDTIQVKIDYDKWTKYDYVQDCTGCQGATYLLGTVTQKVRIIKIDHYMYFYTNSGGKSTTFTTNPNQTYETAYTTANYSNPAPKAIQYYGSPWTEYVQFRVYNTEVAF
ncbi:DUF5022 domain-containing protein [Cohnella sp.]|uniref:DUF5022 domain-containing protein n=1 Tax=Cohnella sp. TaxID=1883426 RepID=UPI00356762C4